MGHTKEDYCEKKITEMVSKMKLDESETDQRIMNEILTTVFDNQDISGFSSVKEEDEELQ